MPCGDSICRYHLSERRVVKENRIECNKCKRDFEVKDNQFKSNKTFNMFVEYHLSEKEKSLKRELEVSVRRFFEFYEEFIQNKSKLELDVFDYFREIRFQIDEHRERLKQQIDDISLEMISEAKKQEETYMKNLKEVFESSSFDDSKSLEDALTDIEETYRDPNLLIQTIQEMQQKQHESLKDIQLRLNQMNKIKDDLNASNQFKPNLIPFNPNKTSCFGHIKLNGYWLNTNSLKSEILKGEQQYLELIKLC